MVYAKVVILGVMLLFSAAMTADEDEETDEDVQKLQQVGAEYLKNVMNQLQSERSEGQVVDMAELTNMLDTERASEAAPRPEKVKASYPITGPTPVPPTVEAEIVPAAPPPALSSQDLAAIYQAAITKGATLPEVQAATRPVSSFHHPPPPISQSLQTSDAVVKPAAQGPAGSSLPGYYYYFYPIKSFLKTPDPTGMQTTEPVHPSTPPPASMHITMMEPPSRGVEPLFMAVSGFIGMALMFVFSVLFLPKFGKFRSADISKLKEAPDELAAFGRLVIESLDGKDCSERLACEIGRVLRRMKLDNKPLRILEIMLPPPMSKQISQVRKSAARKEKCSFIPCKEKTSRPPAKTIKHKNWKKGPTAHDLWMKHFEKEKLSFKQPENIWKNGTTKAR